MTTVAAAPSALAHYGDHTVGVTKGLHDCTVLFRIRCSIPPVIGDKRMHVSSQQFGGVVIAKQTQAGSVAEGTQSLQVDAKNSFGGRIQQQPKLFFAPPQCLFSAFALNNQAYLCSDCGNHLDEALIFVARVAHEELKHRNHIVARQNGHAQCRLQPTHSGNFISWEVCVDSDIPNPCRLPRRPDSARKSGTERESNVL